MNASSSSVSSRVWTLPNAISFARIAMIPVFCAWIVDPDRTALGIVTFGVVLATDWVDGTIARRTGQVSRLGQILDPVADRLAIAAGLIALVVRGAFPLWAALLILVRDLAVLITGVYLLRAHRIRLDVRWVGKAATFQLMVGVPAIAWGTLGYEPTAAALVVGWSSFTLGIVEYYVAAWVYARDIRRALQEARVVVGDEGGSA
jgi:cardiolipin synthase